MPMMPKPKGPYGTNEGDVWSGEDSPVGTMLMERDRLVLIHEMMFRDGKVQDVVYNVAADTTDPDLVDLVQRARVGSRLLLAAQAAQN